VLILDSLDPKEGKRKPI